MAFIKKIKKGGRTYLVRVESYRENGKVKHRYLGYVGKEVDGKTVLSNSVSNMEIESVRLYGPLMVLHSLAEEIRLSEILGEYGDELLSMVYAHCVEPKSINQMERWFEKTDLNFILNLDKVTESRLLDALDSINKQDVEVLQKNIFDEVKKHYSIDTSCVLYDVTNTYFYGRKCFWGKRGKSKEGENDKPLVQIGLGISRKEGIPLFHKTFEGNVHDARTLQGVLPLFEKYEVKKGFIVYDRGIPSKDNILDVKKLGWNTICGMPIHQGLKTIIQNIILQKNLVSLKNRVPLTKTALYAKSQSHTIADIPGQLTVCFNNKLKTLIQESRYDEIQNAQQRLKKKKNIKQGLEKYFNPRGTIKQKTLNQNEKYDGYSCIFSTKKIPNSELIKIYFEKDLVEKAFQNLKGIIALRPIRHWLYDRVEGHIFICYLAYLLLTLLRYKLKKTGITPIEALHELETLYKIYLRDTTKEFELSKTVKLTKKQEIIVKAINKKLLTM